MSKHGQKLRLCAAHMPLIRHSIVETGLDGASDDTGSLSTSLANEGLASDLFPQELERIRETYAGLAQAPLYFVSHDMATLALDTATHGGAPRDTRFPSENGIIGFEGGVHLDGLRPVLNDIGVVCWSNQSQWYTDHPGWFYRDILTYSNTNAAHNIPLWKSRIDTPDFVPVDLSVLMASMPNPTFKVFNDYSNLMPRWTRFWEGVLRAVFALADVPTVTSTRDYKTKPLDRVPRKYDPDLPSNRVRLVDVRENLEAPDGRETPDTGTETGKRREYAYRFIVRGFYRNQPYGPGRKLRRRQWIPPFVKGPADKPLRVKDTVNILRGTVQQEGQQEHE